MADEVKTETTETTPATESTPVVTETAPVAEVPVVEAVPELAPAPVATSVKAKAKVQVVEKPATTPTNFTDMVAQIKKSGTIAQKTLVASIEAYMTNMAPGKPVSNDDGAKFQYQLWKTIHNLAHNAPLPEFRSLWNLLLAYVHNHKQGVFADRYLFRFSEYWIQSIEELNGFQRILNLINLTCDPGTRVLGLRQVNLDATLSEAFTEDARQRILSFYRV
jgi:hypothetical protein